MRSDKEDHHGHVHAATASADEHSGGAAHGVFWLEPNGGGQLRFLSSSTMRLRRADDAIGAIGFDEYVSEPGVTGPPQHVHHGHDETFFVVDGTHDFTVGTDHT